MIGPLAAFLLDRQLKREKAAKGIKDPPRPSYPAEAYLWAFLRVLSYIVPLVGFGYVFVNYGAPTALDVAAIPISIIWNVGICMSMCLHRYFAHVAFTTSRVFQFVLGFVACCGFQGGPIWWAAKHKRHHSKCDTPDDPHAWCHSTLFYAWLGWTMHPGETHVDKKYVTYLLTFPELIVLDYCYLLPCILTNYVWWKLAGPVTMVCASAFPMYMSRILTLFFNMAFHPPTEESEGCASANGYDLLADFVGECFHEDHHDHPTKYCRPGNDLAFWLVLRPLIAMGVCSAKSSRHTVDGHWLFNRSGLKEQKKVD